MPKRKEDVVAKVTKTVKTMLPMQHELEHAHHEAWLANIVALVVVLVFSVYVLTTRNELDRVVQQMSARLVAVEAECRAK